jgi:F-type H+-transporting ATPase subunit b
LRRWYAIDDMVLFLVLIAEGDVVWWNYPGLELWKFINLAIFIGLGIYLHQRYGRPVSEALRSRRESIKRELQKAREEKEIALRKLAEVEARIKHLDGDVTAIREQAKAEAQAERERIKAATEAEMTKMRQQAQREIESAAKAARQELRRFAAAESARLAEEAIQREIGTEDDKRLIAASVEQLGRSKN